MSTSSSPIEISEARAQRVSLTDDALVVDLVDGRTVSVPLAWYPCVEGLLAGRRSGETQASLRRWFESRKAGSI
jgi:hypothetical protein